MGRKESNQTNKLEDLERNRITCFPLIYPMKSLLIIFVFNIIICCTWNIRPRAVGQATQATTRENLSSGFPTKRVSNQSLRLNRLDRKLIFFSHEASLGMILLKKQTTKLLLRLCGCAGWSGPLLLQITWQVFSVAAQLLYVSFNHDTSKNTRCKIWLLWNMITQTEL